VLKTESQGISESQGIPLMLETIREVSENVCFSFFNQSVSLCARKTHAHLEIVRFHFP